MRKRKLLPIWGGEDCSVIGFRFVEDVDVLKRKTLYPPTDNEMLTLKCLANGMEPKDLVSHFGVTRARVDQYIHGLRRKMGGAKTNAQAVAIAFSLGWLTLEDIETPDSDGFS
jgi:hypothetical protein